MKNARMGENRVSKNNKKVDQEVDVLYQRIGDRWYAFSLVNGEVFFGSIDQEELQENKFSDKKEEL